MPHYAKPWSRAGRGWYVQLNKEQIKLAGVEASFDDALATYHELMTERAKEPVATPTKVEPGAQLVVAILDRFLTYCQTHKKPATYATYQKRLQSFTDWLKAEELSHRLTVDDLTPGHLTDWADSHKAWSKGMKHGRIMAIQTCFNRAQTQGWIKTSPVFRVDKPAAGRRTTVVSEVEYADILTKVRNQDFKDLLVAAWESGARPQELTRVEARHYENGTWVFPDSEGKGDEFRRIFLNETMKAVVERRSKLYPEGPIFRNTKGRAWTPFSINCSFIRLEAKIGRKLFLGAFRHTFCTAALKKGINPVAVSVLMGHRDTSMVARIYSHLSQDEDYLRKQAEQVRK